MVDVLYSNIEQGNDDVKDYEYYNLPKESLQKYLGILKSHQTFRATPNGKIKSSIIEKCGHFKVTKKKHL